MNESNIPVVETAPDENASDIVNDPSSLQKKNFSVPIWVRIFLLLIVGLVVFCMLHFSNSFADYRVYMTAEQRIANGETSAAIEDLYKLSEEHTKSIDIVIKTIDLSMENGYYDIAGYVYDNYLTGMSVVEPAYSRMNSYVGQLQKYYATSSAIEQIINENSSSQEYDDINYNAVITDLEAMLKKPEQDYAVIHYYLGIFAGYDAETAKNELKQSYDINPELYDVRVQLGVMYRQLGEYEKTKQLNLEALNKDKSDSGALRSAAIIQMLEGDLEGGAATAKKAYEAYPDGLYIRETYLIALSQNKQEEEAQTIENEITTAGMTLDAEILQLLDGNMTLEDYYVKG